MPSGTETTIHTPNKEYQTPEAHFDKKPKVGNLPDLKICARYKEIIKHIDDNDVSILICATGTGKTIGTPIMYLKAHPDARIVTVEPRNAPMEKIASYTAELIGTQVGDIVGVRYGGSGKQWGDKTQLMYVMEQTLLNEEDPLFLKYNVAHLDEVHEGNVRTSQLFRKLRDAQEIRKKQGLEPLKIVLTSATVDAQDLSKKMDNAKVLEIEGDPPFKPKRTHRKEKVEIKDMPKEAAVEVMDILKTRKEKGDILIFLPGKPEISRFFDELREAGITEEQYDFLSLHAGSSSDEKDKINNRKGDRDRFIACTPSGETGYSFPSPLKHEVDSGLIKQKKIDPDTGMEYMETIPHSWSGCIQRIGRLGRTEPGEARLLYTEEDLDLREKNYKYTTPEIRRISLLRPVLDILNAGGRVETMLKYPEPPDQDELKRTMKSLFLLGALNPDGTLNEIGKEMAEMDIDDPHLARMIIESKQIGGIDIAATITAMMENSDGLVKGTFQERQTTMEIFQKDAGKSDFQTFVNMYREILSHQKDLGWMEKNHIDGKVFEAIVERQTQLLGREKESSNDPDIVGKLALVAFADRLMQKNPNNTYHFLATADHPTQIHIDNDSAASGSGADIVVMGTLRKINGVRSAQNIQPINPEWVKELIPDLLSHEDVPPHFDKKSGKVLASHDTYLGTKVISEEDILIPKEKASEIFSSALAKGEVDGIDVITENNKAIQRVAPEETEKNKGKLEQLYKSRLSHISSIEELKAELAKNPELAHILEIHPDDLKSPDTHSEAQSHTATIVTPSPTNPKSENKKISFFQRTGQKIQQTWNKFVNFLKNLRNLFRRPPPTPIPAH